MLTRGRATDGIPAYVWRVGWVAVLGSIMSVLDTTIVNVALEPLSRDLHTSLVTIQWVVTGYLLALAGTVPVSGWAARRYGARRLYIAALVTFTLGSLLCGLAWSAGSLIAFRVLQGVGGGMIVPVGQMIVVRAAGPSRIGRVMAVLSVPTVLAPVVGPTLGGFLVQHVGWQWIFYVNLPVGVVAVLTALRNLPADEPEEAGRLDLTGLALVSTGLVAITYGLSESGARASVASAYVVVPVIVGLVTVAAFVRRSLRLPRPLLDLRLFGKPAYAAASVAMFFSGAVMFGGMIMLPLFFQLVRGDDPMTTGLLIAPTSLGVAVVMRAAGHAADRYGGATVAVVGIVVATAATAPFVVFDARTPYWALALAMIPRGMGLGATAMPLFAAAYAMLDADEVHDASPQLTVLQRVGGSLGTALLAIVLQRGLSTTNGSAMAISHAFQHTYWWVVVMTAVALLPLAVLWMVQRRSGTRGSAAVPADVVIEVA